MKPYQKNYAPKSRQEVAGGNDHCWISEMQKWPSDKRKYDENFERIFGSEEERIERNKKAFQRGSGLN